MTTNNDVELFKLRYRAKPKSYWVSKKNFFLFCKEGIALAKKYPDDKAKIAYLITEWGLFISGYKHADPEKDRREVTYQAADLEVPDDVIYTGDGLTIAQKWQRLEYLVEAGLKGETKAD